VIFLTTGKLDFASLNPMPADRLEIQESQTRQRSHISSMIT
jgi:hypothetical protein